jgi:AcrR family transcriptional regulator
MKNTKAIILDTSLRLFNTFGLSEVTLRTIAKEMGISQGNLNYHFKKRQDIIDDLYFQLVEIMDIEMKNIVNSQSILQTIFDSSKISMNCFYRYRFFMRDFYIIMKGNSKIHNHYTQLQQVRLSQFAQVFDGLINQEIMRKEDFENEYKRLFARMNILGDNWINTQELLSSEIENPIEYYQSLLFETIYPYLTEKGKLEFHKIKSV